MKEIRLPKIRNVTVKDPLFGAYAALVAESIVPYQWEILNDRVPGAEKSYCIENFKIAAGEATGIRRGVVFTDTDVYKWLEAVAFCIENGSGKHFEPMADEVIRLIGKAQEPDGYLNTYYTLLCPEKRWTNLTEGHELYTAGHFFEAAVAYANATGKREILDIAIKFADLIYDTFGPEEGKMKGYPGHQEVEVGLVKLYYATGDAKYLDLAAFFLDIRGREPNYLMEEIERRGPDKIFPDLRDYSPAYSQSHLPPIEQTTAEGHAVRAMYMYSAMASLAKERKDPAMKVACETLWKNVTQRRMYITGGIGSSGFLERFTTDFDLPNDRTYCETCASIGLMMFGQRMALLSGEASYYDVVERALCNTVLSGINAKGDRYFYVNPLEVWPDNCMEHTSMAHVKPVRQPWFDVACCPTNVARTLSSLGQYIWAEDEDSVYINQFLSSSYETEIRGQRVVVDIHSTCMHDGKVAITVEAADAQPVQLRVRIPEYMKQPVFTKDGVEISPVVEKGYAILEASAAGKTCFAVCADVKARFVAANPNVPADAGKVAVMKGPFVYCLEEQDNGKNLANVYLSLAEKPADAAALTELPGTLPTLTLTGKRLVKSIEDGDALYGEPSFVFEDASFRAVPYCLWCNREPGEMMVWLKAALI